MDDTMVSLLQVMGFVSNAIGVAYVAIKSGVWKGETDNRVKDLECDVADIRVKVESLDGRLNGMEKEFSKTLARMEANVEFIKETVVDLKNKDK